MSMNLGTYMWGGASNNYSTEEQVVGTWIDGKPIYQKTVDFTNVTLSSGSNVDVGTITSDMIVRFAVCYIREGDNVYFPSEPSLRLRILGTKINLISGSSSSWNISYGAVTIQYTKTTD